MHKEEPKEKVEALQTNQAKYFVGCNLILRAAIGKPI